MNEALFVRGSAPDTPASSSVRFGHLVGIGVVGGAIATAAGDLEGGPSARGSCTSGARCHGTSDADGAKIPGGLQYFDQRRCYLSLRDLNLVEPEDAAALENSILLARILRIRNAQGTITGFMPEAPQAYVFSPTAAPRIETWIRDGSKDE